MAFLPNLVGALFVFFVGLLLAMGARRLVIHLVAMLKIDALAQTLEVTKSFERHGLRLHIGRLLGWLVQYFCLIVFLIAATDILGWYQVTDSLKQVLVYLPNIGIAILILLVGFFLAHTTRRLLSPVTSSVFPSGAILSGMAKWAIIVFSTMAALVQLHIAEELIRILFAAFMAMLALAGGLAFGLGGREHASRFLGALWKDVTSDEEGKTDHPSSS